MLLLKQDMPAQRCGHGFNSHPGNPGVAQLVRAQQKRGFESRSQTDGIAQLVEHYTYDVEEKEVHRFLKNGDQKFKVSIVCL